MGLSWSNPSFEQNVVCYLKTPGSALFAVLPINLSESMKAFFRASSKEVLEKKISGAGAGAAQVSFSHRAWEKQGGWRVLAVDSFILPASFPRSHSMPFLCCSERFLKIRGKFNSQLKQTQRHRGAITTVICVYFLCSHSERGNVLNSVMKYQ